MYRNSENGADCADRWIITRFSTVCKPCIAPVVKDFGFPLDFFCRMWYLERKGGDIARHILYQERVVQKICCAKKCVIE